MSTANGSDQEPTPSSGRVFLSRVGTIALFIAVIPLSWAIVRFVPPPWDLIAPGLIGLVFFFVIAVLSRSTVWTLLVYFTPLGVTVIAILLGFRGALTLWGQLLAIIWLAGFMLSERFRQAAFGRLGGLHAWLTGLGLSTRRRGAYREIRRASEATPQEHRDIDQQLDEERAARALRDIATRIAALDAPDERWAGAYDAMAEARSTWADMREGERPFDLEEAERLATRGEHLWGEVLRDESPTYRFLSHVPFGSLHRP